MPTKLGYSDVKHLIQLPATWDLAYLKQFSMRDGTTYDRVVTRVGTALALFNRSLTTGYWGGLLRTTTEMESEYDIGGDGNEIPLYSEYERPDPIIGDMTGHLIPMRDYGGALGWTYLALRRGRLKMIDSDIKALINRSRNTWQKALITRLFTTTVETVGTTGKSLPFADGGTGDTKYIPPSWNGKIFTNTHNHYLRHTADASGRSASIRAMVDHLVEHGFSPPFDQVIPEADIALWTAQTEFRKPERGILSTAGVETRAGVPEETYLGVLETDRGWVRLTYSPRLPTAYAGMFKYGSFGNGANPLVVRFEEGFPQGLSLVATETRFPLMDAIALLTFGAGIGDRLAGVLTHYAASGSYVNPVIT